MLFRGTQRRGISMGNLNKILKIVFILSSLVLLYLLVGSPKTDCQACSLTFDGKTYDGYEAFEYFEDNCISYRKPWEYDSRPLPNISEFNVLEENNMTKNLSILT